MTAPDNPSNAAKAKRPHPRLVAALALLGLFAAGFAVAIWATVGRFTDRRVRLETQAHVAVRHFQTPVVEPEEVAALTEEGDAEPLFVDVRARPEYAVSHLPGAILWDEAAGGPPPTAVREAVHAGRPVVFYCSIGYRSGRAGDAVRTLLDRGANDGPAPRLYNLEGGIFLWAEEGGPLEGADGTEGVGGDGHLLVHPYDAKWGKLLREDLRAPIN